MKKEKDWRQNIFSKCILTATILGTTTMIGNRVVARDGVV